MNKNKRHELITKSFESGKINLIGEREFEPLRKKIKNEEENYVESYYTQSNRISTLPMNDINRLLEVNDIKIEGNSIPRPILYFNDLYIPDSFIHILNYHHITVYFN